MRTRVDELIDEIIDKDARIAELEKVARAVVDAANEEVSQSGYENYSKAMGALGALLGVGDE